MICVVDQINAATDPMAGGMFTEIVKAVFEESDYQVEPMVMPQPP